MLDTKINVLLLENIHEQAISNFEAEACKIKTIPGSLGEDELIAEIQQQGTRLLGIRSKTKVSKKLLEACTSLQAIGAFCVGTDQVDLVTSLEQGVAVFNAPYSNTRSVAELVIALMIILNRNCFDKIIKLRNGIWDKSAKGSKEIRNKSLGIIGYGHIGSQVSIMAEHCGMQVFYYDVEDKLTIGNAKRLRSLEELLQVSDVVSLHVDGRASNQGFFGKQEFAQMKKGAILLNLSRGKVVDLDELQQSLMRGDLRGAAVDVFPLEPAKNGEEFHSPLLEHPNVILTPHIGGSTEEAQKDIGDYVSKKLLEYISQGSTSRSANFPEIQLDTQPDEHRIAHFHKNVPGVLAAINSVFARYAFNIQGQYLKTNESHGYVVIDFLGNFPEEAMQEFSTIKGTVAFRKIF